MATEGDYFLGSDDAEVERLGLQHRVWRGVVLDCWEKAGITVGKRVLDLGAGPGHATLDLAEIVGPEGEVVAVERSKNFVDALQGMVRAKSLDNVRVHQLDLVTDELPGSDFDFSWCRWVAGFVSDRALLVKKMSGALGQNGVAIFHEYAQYDTWQFSPRLPAHERFVELVDGMWRRTRGRSGVALDLPPLLAANGFAVRWATPRIFCLRPNDYMWQWMAGQIESGAARLEKAAAIDHQFINRLRAEFAQAQSNPDSLMITPLILEIVAEKRS